MSNFKPLPGAQLNHAHPLAHGLVGYWLMNEGSGKTVHDYSRNGKKGTIIGMSDPPTATSGWSAGPHGGALTFDGSNDYILPTTTLSASWVTMVAIVKATGTDGMIAGNLSGTGFWTSYGKGFVYKSGAYHAIGTVADNHPSLSVACVDGLHHQVAAVFSANGRLYLDGQQVDAGNISSYHSYPFAIGVGYYPPTTIDRAFKGLISSVSIYDRALSAEEIAYLYAFPYCTFEDAAWQAYVASNNIPIFMNYYRQMRSF